MFKGFWGFKIFLCLLSVYIILMHFPEQRHEMTVFPRHPNRRYPLKLPTLILLRSQRCTSHRFIVSVLCTKQNNILQRFNRAQNNNSAGHYGGGLMLKLMGNASPSHRETFLTLMERGMSRVEVGG